MSVEAQQFLLQKYADFSSPVDLSPEGNFKLVTKTLDPATLKDDEVLVQTIYLSNDPAQKGWFSPYESYIPPVPLGSIAPARGIAKVIASKSDLYKEGDFLSCGPGWSTYAIINGKGPMIVKVDPSKLPLSKYLSVFGSTTMTAYFTAMKYSGLKPEDEGKVWLVTGAAGAAGSALISIISAVFNPKKVVAIAGGDEKVKFVETLGKAVVGVDYKSASYDEDFKKALGDDKINVFADHVGGELLDSSLPYMAVHGRVVQIGAISRYNSGGDNVFNNYAMVITKRLSIQGMVVVDDIPEMAAASQQLMQWFTQGKLDMSKFQETVVDASEKFEEVPKLWTGLFEGVNRGKYITQVAKI